MKAVVLAGGLGTRLKPFTDVIPKPLLPLGNKTLMEIQIQALKGSGFDEIFIATNYKADFVKAYLGTGDRYGVTIHYSEEDKPLGTCGPLTLIRESLTEPFLMMNGDILTSMDFRRMYDTAVARAAPLCVGTKVITTPFRFGNVTVNDDGCITAVEEKPEFCLEVVAGIYVMTPAVFDYIPVDRYFGMDSLIMTMLEAEATVFRYAIQEYWIDIGQVEDYTKARQIVADHFE